MPAAQYIRMSTEHQRYSTENQSDCINRYAEQRGITITHEQIEGAGHFFDGPGQMEQMIGSVSDYVKRRLTESSR